MTKEKPAIVVVAYNRINSLKRLLKSLSYAIYETAEIDLIISIDLGDNEEVIELSEAFEWKWGKKKIIIQPENLGLRKHVLKCGKLTLIHKSIILLEDDIVVARDFYDYACKALSFSRKDDRISQISLYKHSINVNCREPFMPIKDNEVNWYSQFPCSWGQAWTDVQWELFERWYEENKTLEIRAHNVPEYVSAWKDSSWLKYYLKYNLEMNKYVLYPHSSYSTNFGDQGTHASSNSTNFQVQLAMNKCSNDFVSLNSAVNLYDVFFENIGLVNYLDNKYNDCTIDLYGKKTDIRSRYILTRKILDYKIIDKYGCLMKPMDMNIIYDIKGNGFFLYDTSVTEKNPSDNFDLMEYIFPCLNFEHYKALKTSYLLFFQKIIWNKVKGIMKG